MRVGVMGLGKLGACLVASLAHGGHTVTGFDISAAAVGAINSRQPLVHEPGLADLLEKNAGRISATQDVHTALHDAEAVFIIVPTPSGPAGDFSNTYVAQALEAIGANLRANPRRITVVISSTVMPGSCETEFIPLLEASSGLTVGKEIGLGYSPEFIALGSVLKDMSQPDLILIGQSDAETGAIVSKIALSMVSNTPEVRNMSLSSAEITKIAINTFVTTKISFANMLSELCDEIPGSNIDDVTSAVGSDRRVGKLYLKAALGYGGPCFPRDNAALAFSAESRGLTADIARATDSVNRRQVERIVSLVLQSSQPGDKVGVLGLAYKPNTPVIDESQGLEIARALSERDRAVVGFDPLVAGNVLEKSPNFVVAQSSSEMAGATVVVVANPELGHILESTARGAVIIDMWGAHAADSPRIIRPGRPE
ncbi:nucleotide sugar dehydrogenase [Pontimonas sp.]|nr:nucleotide sugar dehydrogenase [Pontimonas sp.]